MNTRAIKIDTDSKTITAMHETQGPNSEYTTNYDQLILAVGSAPLKPPIPGINRDGLFVLRNLQDMDAIVNWIQSLPDKCETCSDYDTDFMNGSAHNKMHAVVAGAGFVGLEMVEQLMRRGLQVTVVEMLPQVLGPLDVEMAAIIEEDMEKKGVTVVTGDGIQAFLPNNSCDKDDPSTIVKLQSGRELPSAQITILGMGVRPDTKVVREAGIECTRRGHIVVDDHLRTNKPGVWAAGDAIEVHNPIIGGEWAVALAGPANRQGRMIADNIYGMDRKFRGTYAASVVRVHSLVAACVGMNEKMLAANNIPHQAVHVHPGSHAGYFPGAKSLNFKLLFNPQSGKVLGAQCVGQDGVEKRIDVISTAMQGNLTVQDLADLELCYAPPVGSAKDPVNIAGMAAQNIIDGLVEQIDWKELKEVASQPGVAVLDVRNAAEISKNGALIDGAINIPLNHLRERMDEIPSDTKRVVVSCASGQRAYYATRILKQSGKFERVENLGGAYKTFSVLENASKSTVSGEVKAMSQ